VNAFVIVRVLVTMSAFSWDPQMANPKKMTVADSGILMRCSVISITHNKVSMSV
jgi:hypothetical protein